MQVLSLRKCCSSLCEHIHPDPNAGVRESDPVHARFRVQLLPTTEQKITMEFQLFQLNCSIVLVTTYSCREVYIYYDVPV